MTKNDNHDFLYYRQLPIKSNMFDIRIGTVCSSMMINCICFELKGYNQFINLFRYF